MRFFLIFFIFLNVGNGIYGHEEAPSQHLKSMMRVAAYSALQDGQHEVTRLKNKTVSLSRSIATQPTSTGNIQIVPNRSQSYCGVCTDYCWYICCFCFVPNIRS